MASVNHDNRGLRLAARYAVLSIVAMIFIFPLMFMVMSTLKPDLQLLRDTGNLRAFLPVGDISLDNYTDAFERAPVGHLRAATRCSSPAPRCSCRFFSVRSPPSPSSI